MNRREPIASEHFTPNRFGKPVEPPESKSVTETPKNVLPFRPPGDAKPPSLTPVENSAFNELARQLSARLETEMGADATPDVTGIDETVVEEPASPDAARRRKRSAGPQQPPEWLAPPEPPARGEARRDKALLDLLPVGVLIYRLDRLLYANPRSSTQMGYPEPARAGGGRRPRCALCRARRIDRLQHVGHRHAGDDFGEPAADGACARPRLTDARLYTISWDGDSALALIFSGTRNERRGDRRGDRASRTPVAEPTIAAPSPVGHANAEELGAILDTTAEGIVMFDAEGNINSCQPQRRSAVRL